MNSIKILIVEDEIIIAQDIEFRLSELGYDVVKAVEDVKSAIQYIENNRVDIAIIDITLQGIETGLDLAKFINENIKIPFIILTSNTETEVVEEVKKLNPAAYLLKPFNDKQMAVSIEMALYNFYGEKAAKGEEEQEKSIMMEQSDSLFLKKNTHYEKVKFDSVLWLEAESNYTYIYTKSGKYTYSTVLKKFEDRLPSDQFLRVHRSFIVNIRNITGFEGNMLLIEEKYIPVSKNSREEVFKRFDVL